MAERPANLAQATTEMRLEDYRPPAFFVDTVDLIFDLDTANTRVRASLSMRRNQAFGHPDSPLILDGENLTLVAVAIDGEPLQTAAYTITAGTLVLPLVPDEFILDTEVIIDPESNTELSGLYVSGGDFFTQCEAEGFRRITFFPDRPDVMARYSATLIASRERFPILLSNGNPVDRGTIGDGRHWVKWVDPHPKPSYLFALVAGDLVGVHDRFVTASGRAVTLGIYVRGGDQDKVGHAMDCLKRAMRWDETTFGLEYDLDIFNIAAVGDFNMGAMENKGLNIFNTALVLAKPDTATDADYLRIDRVIAHEYFHNWTGDRITCRDWFQLSLKEGLTVFRDQEYGADTTDPSLSRIDDVVVLRSRQFREDAGPLAHPVRPRAYRKIDNFYTATIYEKGAEIVRMIRTIIGAQAFRRGMDIYVARNDNAAATIEDFLAAMQDASGHDLSRFALWYEQAGTPEVSFTGGYDAAAKRYVLTVRQANRPSAGQPRKDPLVIPIAMGLLGASGAEMSARLDGEATAQKGTRVLLLEVAVKSFVFEDVASEPVPSLFRNFSAPIRLAGLSRAQLGFLASNDSDGFNRWEAGQEFATQILLAAVETHQRGENFAPDPGLLGAMAAALDLAEQSPGLAARILTLPTQEGLAARMAVIDPDTIHLVHGAMKHAIGTSLRGRLLALYQRREDRSIFSTDPASMGWRALRNVALGYLMAADSESGRSLARDQLHNGRTMTEAIAALSLLADSATPERDEALAAFHAKWRADALVIDKWFRIQALADAPDTVSRIEILTRHPDFEIGNPNRFRSLIAAFGVGNQRWFHDASGDGYRLVSHMIIKADRLNRQSAARMVDVFSNWNRFDLGRQAKMRAALGHILASPGLSENTREMAERALGD